jgi:hypothetical protein
MMRPLVSLSIFRSLKEKTVNISMDMLSVVQIPSPKGPVPNGMKVATIAGPNVLQPLKACPVLAVGSFTLWPMSYIDNRVSFGMVMYDPTWQVVNQVEKPGARYVYKVTADKSGSVTFSGQSDQSIKMSLDEICQMMMGSVAK